MSQFAAPSASAVGCCMRSNNDCLQDDFTLFGIVVWSRSGPAQTWGPKDLGYLDAYLDLHPICWLVDQQRSCSSLGVDHCKYPDFNALHEKIVCGMLANVYIYTDCKCAMWSLSSHRKGRCFTIVSHIAQPWRNVLDTIPHRFSLIHFSLIKLFEYLCNAWLETAAGSRETKTGSWCLSLLFGGSSLQLPWYNQVVLLEYSLWHQASRNSVPRKDQELCSQIRYKTSDWLL